MTRRPMFLERRGYRRRRLMDAARILPVIGAILLLMPLVWSLEPGRVMGTAGGGIYVFAVWGFLVAGAFVMARVLRPVRETGTGAGGDGDGRVEGNGGDGERGDVSDGALFGGGAPDDGPRVDPPRSGGADEPGRDETGKDGAGGRAAGGREAGPSAGR